MASHSVLFDRLGIDDTETKKKFAVVMAKDAFGQEMIPFDFIKFLEIF